MKSTELESRIFQLRLFRRYVVFQLVTGLWALCPLDVCSNTKVNVLLLSSAITFAPKRIPLSHNATVMHIAVRKGPFVNINRAWYPFVLQLCWLDYQFPLQSGIIEIHVIYQAMFLLTIYKLYIYVVNIFLLNNIIMQRTWISYRKVLLHIYICISARRY